MKQLALLSVITLLSFTVFSQEPSREGRSNAKSQRTYQKSKASNAYNSPRSSTSSTKSQTVTTSRSTTQNPSRSSSRVSSSTGQKTTVPSTRESSRDNKAVNSYHSQKSQPNYRSSTSSTGVNSYHTYTSRSHAHTTYKPGSKQGINYYHGRSHYHRVSDYRKPYYEWNHHYIRPERYPRSVYLVWTYDMYVDYRVWYPYVDWRISYGTRINTISAWDALYYVGDIKRVYGKVYETYYDANTNSYYLYFSAPYPYHKFSVVIPASLSYRFRYDVLRYYNQAYVEVTGLITEFNGKPEIVVHSPGQIDRY